MAKNLSRKVTIYINGKEVEASIKNINARIAQLRREQERLPIGTQEYINKSRELARLNGILRSQREAVNALNSSWDTASVKLTTVANLIQSVYALFQLGDMAIGSLKDLAADAAELDDVYADVMKTTGLTREQVLELNESFKKMDTRTSREQLNQLAYEAGKLGINSKEAVEQFVSASDKINIALGDVLGEGAMVTIGKMAEVYAKSTQQLSDASGDLEKQMLAIGSAINQLGQSSTANEGYMVEFLSRMGGIATQAGLSADAILGFASALDQDMMKQEMSATAFQKFIMQMIKMPEKFAKSAQMSVSDFAKLMEKDMNEALLRVLEGFQGEGGLVALQPIFEDLGLDAARAASVISSMANSIDKVREAQSIANQELTTGDSIIREFNTKNNTMQAQAEKARKVFQDVRIELGEKLYPVLISFTKSGTAALRTLGDYLNLWKENKVAAVALTSGILGLVVALSKAQLVKAKDRVLDAAHIISTKYQTFQTARHTAAVEADRLAVLKQQLAINKKIVAQRAEYAAIGANNLVLAAERNIRVLTTRVTEQQTVATKASSAALKATPWGLVIALATGAAFAIAKYVQNSRRFRKESKETAKQIGQETAQATYLLDRIENLDKSTEEYRSTLSQLNDLYPEIIAKYKDEEGNLRNIAAARQEIIDKIRQQVVEQRRLDKYGDIAGNFASSTESAKAKMLGYLTSKFGASQGQTLYSSLISRLPSTYDSDVNWQDLYKIVEETTTVDLGDLMAWNKLKRAVNEYGNALHDAYTEQQKWEKIYNDAGGSPASSALTDSDFTSGSSSSSPSSSPSPTPTFDEKEVKKWQTVVDQVNNLITSFGVKSKEGLDKLFAEIEAQVASARKDIEEASGATRSQKDNLLAQLNDAADKLRRAKVDEYLKKVSDQVQKLNKASNDNPKLQEVYRASQQLAEQMKEYDDQIFILQSDLQQTDLATEEREKIEQLIAAYQRLKQQMTASAYAGIDTAVNTSGFALTGDRQKDAQQYANLTAQINRAREATAALRDLATDQATREEYEAQLTDLQEQQETLDKLYAGADKFAEKLANNKALDRFIERFEFFGNYALQIFGNINKILDNIGQKELNDAEDLKNANIEKLDEQLEKGLISQETYDEKKLKIEKEYDAKQKEIELEQWQREKWLSASEAAFAAALAILRVYSDKGNGTTAMRIAQTAVIGAATAAQIAAIASEPAPYAKGGYVRHKTYMVGEAGSEWVASHRLLSDPATAPIISALDAYQRGRLALQQVNLPAVREAAAARSARPDLSSQLLAEVRQLSVYLSDPANRRAVISRRTQEQFDANENFLRSVSRL